MRLRIWSTVFALGLVAVFGAGAMAETTAPRIVVSGTGEVAVAPDMAVLTIGAVEEASDADRAMDAVSARMRDLFEVLAEEGVAERDLQTTRLNLQPIYDQSGQVRFRASNQVVVRLRDLTRVGAVLGRTVGAGANNIGRWQSGLRLDVADPAAFTAEARRLAVADAKAKAEGLAEAAGARLGPVREISEHGGGRSFGIEQAAVSRAADVPVAGGEITIRVDVQMIYDLVP